MTLEELRAAAGDGTVDTVLLAMTDMQGRLQGKRLTATHFLQEVAEHGAESCNYLLAVDVDMRTVEGYAMSSWERGYSDMVLVPDIDTLRPVPWQEGTAVCLADVAWPEGSDVSRLPAPGPAPPAGAPGRARLDGERGDRARVPGVPRHLRAGVAGRATWTSGRPISTTSTTRCSAPRASSP